jgi:hypothetical protein
MDESMGGNVDGPVGRSMYGLEVFGWMSEFMDGWVDGRIDGWVGKWMDGWEGRKTNRRVD